VIEADVASGDFPHHVDPELASLSLSGAIFYRLATPEPFDPAAVPALVETVLG
jgi:hypothetical protein